MVALGSTLLTLAAVFQFADGTQVVVMGSLRGLQETRVPMLLTTRFLRATAVRP